MEDETDKSAELEFIAANIKKHFIDNKYKSMPGFNTASYEASKYHEDFMDAAELCLKLDANPETFVNCQFRNKVDGTKIFPAFLKSDVAIANYKVVECQDMKPEDEYEIQSKYLRNQIVKGKRRIENILMDDDIPFTAWFRVCVSTEIIPAVLLKYVDEAAKEAKKNPKLVKFLKDKGLDYTRII